MAIAYDNVCTDTFSIAGVANLTSATFAIAGSDRCLFGFSHTSAGTPATHSGMKWQGSGGTALTQIGSTLSVGSFNRISAWQLIAPTAATDAIYGNWSASQDECSICGIDYTGVNQTTPAGTPVTNTGTWTGAGSTDMTVAITTAVGDVVLAIFCAFDGNGNSPLLTPNGTPAGTGRYEVEGTQMTFESVQVQEVVATGTTTTVSCAVQTTSGNASGDWGVIAFVVNAASGGGGGSIAAISNYYRMMRNA